MNVTNEPGYYEQGKFGIRIENLMFVVEDDSEFLKFQNFTVVPYDRRLIVKELLP